MEPQDGLLEVYGYWSQELYRVIQNAIFNSYFLNQNFFSN